MLKNKRSFTIAIMPPDNVLETILKVRAQSETGARVSLNILYCGGNHG